ncbi:MAG: helix-turn-helix domain-containing protein [Coraliomargaritaceae bacterium]
MNSFGDAVRQLMEAKKVSGLKLAESIGITPTSVSRILNGQSRPRQNTFTRMCQTLCGTKEEEQKLVTAFAGTELMRDEHDRAPPSSEKEILRLRTEQFMERKTQSIQFKRSVACELNKLGFLYEQDYCEGIYSTDFLIEKDDKKIALECKANIDRDIQKTVAQAEMIVDKLGYPTLVVAPYLTRIMEFRTKGGVKIFPINNLQQQLQDIFSEGK